MLETAAGISNAVIAALEREHMLTLFVVIGLGYLLGRLRIFGFSLGVAGVLFAGLFIGSLSPQITLPEFLPSLGLIVYVYTIGIQAGPQFFNAFRSEGYRYTLLALVALLIGVLFTAGLAKTFGLSNARAAGLYAGALTSTPALAAARDKLKEEGVKDDPVAAYSISYPFGVVGTLLGLQLVNRHWRTRKEEDGGQQIGVQTFVVTNPALEGSTVSKIQREHGELSFVMSRIVHTDNVELVGPETELHLGDTVAVVGNEESLEAAGKLLGHSLEHRLEEDRSELDHLDLFVSSGEVVGRTISELKLQRQFGATITRFRRGDLRFVPHGETSLEHGDYIRLVTNRSRFSELRRLFGDSIRGTAEMDFGSVALGMVLGVLLGLLPIPVPGVASITLGLAGGPLLVSMILGKLERTGNINWTIPTSANLSLRQFGVIIFLAGVGTRAGSGFVTTLRTEGALLLGLGAAITILVHAVTLIAGHTLLKARADVLMGISSGVQTQGACLAYASEQCRSEYPDAGYASVYPAAMIAKIICAQGLVLFLS